MLADHPQTPRHTLKPADAKTRERFVGALVVIGGFLLILLVETTSGLGLGQELATTRPASTHPSFQVVPGSTAKVEQLIGDSDAQSKQPTTNRSQSRYGIEGTDLGYSFEYNGQAVFLFGDTLGPNGGDPIGYSASTDPNGPLGLDFVTGGDGHYLRIQPPGVPMGAYEVPVGGIAVNGVMYVAVKTAVTQGWDTEMTVLTRYDDAAKTFTPLRAMSKMPGGHFITESLRMAPDGLQGLPTAEPYVLIFGSGKYRESNAYLAAVPAAGFETGKGTVYYAGRGPTGPKWSVSEADAAPIIDHSTIGDISVTFVPEAGVWVSLYDSRSPQGIVIRYATQPWGPWSAPQVVFDPKSGYGSFMHDPTRSPDDGLAGPVIAEGKPAARVTGGYYAPYIIDRFTRIEGDTITLQYLMSTWNPYTVVRMKSSIRMTP